MALTQAWSGRALGNSSFFFNQSMLPYLVQDRQLERLYPSPNLLAFSLLLTMVIVALATNATSIVAHLSWSKMRQAQNIMLVNISVADMLFCLASLVPAFAIHLLDTSSDPTTCRLVYYCLFVCLYVSVYSPVLACLFRCLSEFMRRHASKQRHVSSRARVLEENSDVFFNNFKSDNRHDSFLTATSAVLSCIVLWLAFCVANSSIFHSKDSTTASLLVIHQPLQCHHSCFTTLRQREEQQRQKERELHSPSEVFKQHFNKKIQQPQLHLPLHQQQQLGLNDAPNDDDSTSENTSLKHLWLTFLISAFLCPLACVFFFSGLLLFSIHCTRSPNRAPISELSNSARITASLTASPVSYSPFTATNSMLADYAAVVSSRKDAVVLLMVISIVRFLCWLPVHVCFLIDIYAFSTHYPGKPAFFHQSMEIFGACCALIACCVNPLIYFASSSDFRHSLVRCRRRWCARKERKNLSLTAINAARMQNRGLPQPDLCTPPSTLSHPLRYSSIQHTPIFPPIKDTRENNDTILSILCDSSNKINYN